MAGLEDLAKYLVAGSTQSQAIAADDPYSPMVELSNALTGQVAGAQGYSTKDKIKAALATSLLGGIFSGLSQNYRTRASDSYQDVLAKFAMGQNPERPGVLSDSLFSSARQQGSLFQIQRALNQQAAQQELENAILKERAVQGLKSEAELGMYLTKLKAENPAAFARFTGESVATGDAASDALLALPENLRGKGAEELASKTKAANLRDSAAKLFQQARGIDSLQAMIPGTQAANDFAGIRSGLELFVNSAAGREINEGSRKALVDALPDWNDTKEQIDAKEVIWNQILGGLQAPSPLLGGAQSQAPAVTVPATVTRDQAIAEARRRGLIR